MKILNLGRVLSKAEQRSVSGGCPAAEHCETAFWGSSSQCLTSPAEFAATGIIYKSGCRDAQTIAYFNCWDDACNAQSS